LTSPRLQKSTTIVDYDSVLFYIGLSSNYSCNIYFEKGRSKISKCAFFTALENNSDLGKETYKNITKKLPIANKQAVYKILVEQYFGFSLEQIINEFTKDFDFEGEESLYVESKNFTALWKLCQIAIREIKNIDSGVDIHVTSIKRAFLNYCTVSIKNPRILQCFL